MWTELRENNSKLVRDMFEKYSFWVFIAYLSEVIQIHERSYGSPQKKNIAHRESKLRLEKNMMLYGT